MVFDTMILGYNGNIMLGEKHHWLLQIPINTWGILLQITCLMKQTLKIKKGVCTGDVMLCSEHSIFAPKT